jgi:hypothetical protein
MSAFSTIHFPSGASNVKYIIGDKCVRVAFGMDDSLQVPQAATMFHGQARTGFVRPATLLHLEK